MRNIRYRNNDTKQMTIVKLISHTKIMMKRKGKLLWMYSHTVTLISLTDTVQSFLETEWWQAYIVEQHVSLRERHKVNIQLKCATITQQWLIVESMLNRNTCSFNTLEDLGPHYMSSIEHCIVHVLNTDEHCID